MTKSFCEVTEYYAHGDLEHCHGKGLGLHTMPKLAKLLLDIASGTRHLHAQQPPIVHRDIRCANVLLHADGHAVLGDWGLSRSIEVGGEEEKAKKGKGEGEKKGPEWFNSKPSKSGYVASAGSMTPWPWTAPEALLCGTYSSSSDMYMVRAR